MHVLYRLSYPGICGEKLESFGIEPKVKTCHVFFINKVAVCDPHPFRINHCPPDALILILYCLILIYVLYIINFVLSIAFLKFLFSFLLTVMLLREAAKLLRTKHESLYSTCHPTGMELLAWVMRFEHTSCNFGDCYFAN